MIYLKTYENFNLNDDEGKGFDFLEDNPIILQLLEKYLGTADNPLDEYMIPQDVEVNPRTKKVRFYYNKDGIKGYHVPIMFFITGDNILFVSYEEVIRHFEYEFDFMSEDQVMDVVKWYIETVYGVSVSGIHFTASGDDINDNYWIYNDNGLVFDRRLGNKWREEQRR